MAEKKEKQFVSDNAQLMAEWNWNKNNESGYNPEKLTCGSNKKVWWKCLNGHEWQAVINSRNCGYGCPYCSGRFAIKGINDLKSINPSLAGEWNYKRNGNLSPEDITANSGQKVWWECNARHEWQATIASRNSGKGCPFCANQKVLKGYNDLQTINPELAKEWNHEKNEGLIPAEVLPNSNKYAWWICGMGHEWKARISHRNHGHGCPYCAGQKVIKNYNDLQTINPTLAREWNYEKNIGLTPADVMPNSHKKVWWICNRGHEWQSPIDNRNQGNGCPVCNSERNTSLPEYMIMFYLRKYGIDVIHSYKDKGYELDVYIPSKSMAIEYDGYYWHKNKIKLDKEKNQKCKSDGITLFRIREGLSSLNDSSIDYVVRKDRKDLAKIIEQILIVIIGYRIDVDIVRDAIDIENLRGYTEKENSLLILNEEISREWNFDKNGSLKPEFFAVNSGKNVWWKCSQGHEWQAIIANRNRGSNCPYCSNKKILAGYNDLLTLNPNLAKEWNYEKNEHLKPDNFATNSGKKVWWKCAKGHEWQATIASRNTGTGCPFCTQKKIKKGYNDLQTANISIANEWNYERNIGLIPTDVTANSHLKVWWKCSEGHEWQTTINSRNRGTGCPYCAGQIVLNGKNDLLTINPILASEWNYEKNNGITPSDVMPNSGKNVWWKCEKGHEWQTTVANRTKGSGCQICSGYKILKGYNDLQTVNSDLAKEWNFKKNIGLTPSDVMPNSNKKVWWKCNKGHEWQTTINSRNRGAGCPYCAGRYAIKGENDLQTVNPDLAKEWNYNKNIGILPMDVLPNSDKKVWWICNKGHEWESTICNRSSGYGCPYCAGRYAIKGENDLQTVNPDLAKEWNYNKNIGILPMDVLPNSDKKVWWKCSKGHEWESTVAHRNNGRGCPICYQNKRKTK